MTKRRKILLLACGLIMGVVLVIFFYSLREPSYKGKKLSALLLEAAEIDRSYKWPKNDTEEYRQALKGRSQQNREAIRSIGTNAIPFFLEWLQNGEPTRHHKFREKANRWLTRIHRGWEWEDQRNDLADATVFGFEALGPQAKGAIPKLTTIMNDPQKTGKCIIAVDSLAGIGAIAYPPLIEVVTNTNRDAIIRRRILISLVSAGYRDTNAVAIFLMVIRDPEPEVRETAMRALREIAPQALWGALTNQLSNPDPSLRKFASWGLGKFSPSAFPVTPLLVAALNDPDKGVRMEATNALVQISPEALTNAMRGHSP